MQRLSGLVSFAVIWSGQVISMMGSHLTAFATLYWAYQVTQQATSVSLLALCTFAPSVLVGPVAGALVDRWNRKRAIMLSDAGAALSTLALLLLYQADRLETWHLYAAGALNGVFETFHWPASMATMSALIPKAHYARANGLVSLASSGVLILAPALAGALLPVIGIAGIFLIDICTCLIAIGLVLIARIPDPHRRAGGTGSRPPFWQEAGEGFRFIRKRPGLLGLQLVFLLMNLFNNLGQPVRQTMVLVRSNDDPAVLAAVNSATAFGSLAGGALMTIWGGFRHKVNGVLLGMVLQGLLGSVLFGLGGTPVAWMAAAFAMQFCIAVLQTSANAIWQSKVPLDLQGRVMSIRRLIAHAAIPLGMALSGPLADRVFEPAMASDSPLVPLFGPLVGSGRGAGMGLMLVLAGALSALVGLGGWLFPAVREIDSALPDHDEETDAARSLS